jgi:RHS repeat-associated protein
LTVTKDGVLVESYSYDISGTRITETNTLRGISGRAFSYSDEDHLLTAGSVTYAYDPDGFLTTKTDGTDITTYNYSSRGELLRVTLPDGTLIEYIHDPLGRRIAKKVNGSIVEKYLWQGLTRLLAVYDGADNLLMRFEYAGLRMPVALTYGGVTYYLAYDQVGALRVVADSSGNVAKLIDYDSFGNIISDSNPAFEVPFGFAGGLYDPDTELVRFGYRDYDPDIGRWTAKDPILFAGGDTDLYGYVLNDPINYTDPLGLLVWGWMGEASGGVVAVGDVSAAVLVEGWFNDAALALDISGTIGPQVSTDLGTGPVIAPFADRISDLGEDSYRISLRAYISADIAIPKNNWKNFSISLDILPGFDFGAGWGGGWTWLFGEDEPCD